MAQTSDKVSSIAARYTNVTAADIEIMSATQHAELAKDIRSMAASLLRQDEVKGLRKLARLVGLGKTA